MTTKTSAPYSTDAELTFIRVQASRHAFPHSPSAEERQAFAAFLLNCRRRTYDRSVNEEAVHDLVRALEISHGLD